MPKVQEFTFPKIPVLIFIFPDQTYTALIPFDEAFRAWYPIDWGFNPFDVDDFVRETLLDHFLVGSVDQEMVPDGAKYRTVSGKEVRPI